MTLKSGQLGHLDRDGEVYLKTDVSRQPRIQQYRVDDTFKRWRWYRIRFASWQVYLFQIPGVMRFIPVSNGIAIAFLSYWGLSRLTWWNIRAKLGNWTRGFASHTPRLMLIQWIVHANLNYSIGSNLTNSTADFVWLLLWSSWCCVVVSQSGYVLWLFYCWVVSMLGGSWHYDFSA
jgi:hypothetical protein